MAITDIELSGYIFQDDGDAVNGATVAILETGTTTQEDSTTTNSDGLWTFTETSLDTTYDVKVTSGSSVRKMMWADEIALKGVDTGSLKIRGAASAAAPLYFFADRADDAGDSWRIQANPAATGTLTIGSDKASAGTIIDYITITNGANAAASVVALGGDLTVGDDLSLTSDSAVFNMGAGNDFTITHDGTTGATIAGNPLTLDSGADIVLDAEGGDIFFKDGGTTFGSATNTSGNLIIKSGTTTALTFSGANVTGAGTYTGGGLMTTGGNIVIPNAGNIGSASDTDAIAISSAGVVTMDQIPVFSAGINVSGGTIAGTLATEAQGNVTSLGTLTALTVDDVAVNGKVITMTGSSSDTAVFTAGTNGTLSIVTTDAAAAAANIQITADGTVDIDSAGVLTLDSGAAINIEPASGSAILLDGTISVDAGVVTGATSITSTVIELGHASDTTIARSGSGAITVEGTQVLLAGAQTGVTTILNASTKIGRDTDNLVDFATTDNNIIFRANGENQLTLSDGALTPSSNAIVDLGTDALEFKDAYFDGTLEADAITIGGTNVVTGSLITTLSTISAGVWEGTDVGVAHGGTGASTLTANGVLIGNGTSAVTAVDQSTKGHILIGDGSGNPQMLAVGSNDTVLTADSGETTGVKWAAASGGGGDYESTIGAGGSTSLTGNKRYIIAPGTTMTGAVTLSNANTHLRIGAGVDFDGNVLTISGSGCSVVCENGVTFDGIVMSGTMCSFDGGGWKTKSNGGTSRHGFSVTNNECMVTNMTLETTGGGGSSYDAFNGHADSDQLTVSNLYIENSDGVGIDVRGNQTRVYGCWIGSSDEEGIYTAGNRCIVNGNNIQEPTGNGIGAGGDDCAITGNIVRKMSQTGGAPVNLEGSTNDHVVVGNRLGGAISDSSSSSTITGNDTDNLT